jgi:hypothetical protein
MALMTGLFALAACGTWSHDTVPTVPPIPSPPQMDPESCYNMNNTVYQIEAYKKLTGHYGEGEEERLAQVRLAAAILGCYLDSAFEPRPPASAPAT